jgi:hypothetical protein
MCNVPLGAGEAALYIGFKGSDMPRSKSSFGSPDTKKTCVQIGRGTSRRPKQEKKDSGTIKRKEI